MPQPRLRAPLGDEPRFISGSTAAVLGTLSQRQEKANMARLEGTGIDPRYGKGEIFDVPMYAAAPGGLGVESNIADRELNPDYKELIDSGKATAVAPEDDPARTPTQIADAVVSQQAAVLDPVDAKLADELDINDAYAIVHTGDANATDETGTLKPQSVVDAQRDDPRQFGATTLAQEISRQHDEDSDKNPDDGGQPEQDIDSLRGQPLDDALGAAGIDGSRGGSNRDGSMNTDEKRAALKSARG